LGVIGRLDASELARQSLPRLAAELGGKGSNLGPADVSHLTDVEQKNFCGVGEVDDLTTVPELD